MVADSRVRADLHCHSTVSDGVLAPRALQAEAREAARALGLDYLAGVEISVTWASRTVHIVGLGFDAGDRALETGLRETRSGRAARARRIGENFARLGIPGVFEGALLYAGNPELVSRTHFARFLVQAGHCPDVQSVFDRYLSDDGIANEPMQWATLENAVRWIHDAGGRAVIAHPGRYHYSPTQFAALFDSFKDLGGEAIEVVTGSHTPAQFIEFAAIARGYGFMASCGSDFHSPSESRHDLGSLPLLPADLTPVWDSLL